MKKDNVIIYGLGNFYLWNETAVEEIYNVIAYVDRKKQGGQYRDKQIVSLDTVKEIVYEKIVIMIQDIQECIRIAKEMLGHGIQAEDIILGRSVFGEYSKTIDEMKVQADGNLLVRFGEASIKVKSNDEFNNMYEVYNSQIYNYFLNNGKRDIVLDVGMNIGDATLYFALKENVERVYGYEPFRETFLDAEENLKDCSVLSKIELLNYGISNESEIRAIGYNRDMSCGQSTLSEVREQSYATYLNWGLVKESEEKTEQIEVRKASEVVAPLFTKHVNCNMILKMNCEGEEYGIVADLLQGGFLGRFSFIMLEWHYKGKEPILSCLKEAGMSWWCFDKNEKMGFIYAYPSGT